MSPSSEPETPAKAEPRGVRLQKVLATAGLGSRRECEELILAGRVEVDRRVVSELGTRVDPRTQEIRVDGESLRPPHLVYYALNKPAEVVCTARDPSGRPRAIDLVPPEPRVFAVGRLDMSSEGLLLLTNDGDLANGLTHPRHEVEKVYRILVAGNLGEEEVAKLRHGLHLAEGFAKPRRIRIISAHSKRTWLEMVLDEGRNREIRRLLARVGHKVQRLTRIAIGSLRLGEMPRGAYRLLRRDEVEALRRDVADSRRRHREPKKSAEHSAEPRRPRGAKPRRKKALVAVGGSREFGAKKFGARRTGHGTRSVPTTLPGRPAGRDTRPLGADRAGAGAGAGPRSKGRRR